MTRQDTIKALCKIMITRLENEKQIVFPPKDRQEVSEELFGKLSKFVLSDEDLKERTIQKLHGSVEALTESDISESDQYRSAMKIVKSQIGENELNGLYYQSPIRDISKMVVDFLMGCDKIEDVFETDEVPMKRIVEIIQKFNPKDLH